MAEKATPAQLNYIRTMAEKLGLDTDLNANDELTKKAASVRIDILRQQLDKQNQAARYSKMLAEQDALESVEPLCEGRVQFAGTIVMARGQDSPYGYTHKMLVKDDLGRKVWMTVPKTILETHTVDDLKGVRVSGVVTLQLKENDSHFAFGSRPAGFHKVS